MLTTLKSRLLGTPQPLYLSATPASGRQPPADQQNDEVSIAFVHADINAPSTAEGGQGPTVVNIYRGWQSRAEYLGDWLADQADVVRQVRQTTADTVRLSATVSSTPRHGLRPVPTGSHDDGEALRPRNRRNWPDPQARPTRPRGPQASRITDTDRLDRYVATPLHVDGPSRCPSAPHAVEVAARKPAVRIEPAAGLAALVRSQGMEPRVQKGVVHISRCLTEFGHDEPNGPREDVGLAALAGVESLGLSRSIRDMGRGW
ncbi:hypothetical protein EM868_17750 [Cupriavidus gilardii]|uniref:hypothetical protein n=1 Tax=Cupriavidus gilardii TaxID=82541 RepID=UPI001EE6058B|nr:hypothetical protein [Cupriavidus gilardii]MCG5262704.1 hypothetical protein [Cupriavidus gilardii]MDF9431622.1 hypothetical protein [Cupriavidus gilardii]